MTSSASVAKFVYTLYLLVLYNANATQPQGILHLCMQLEEYKDAFRIFDRSGTGSFTAEDIGWVMRSLGQNPNEQQIDAIIRDMDLDNDGVIDLAEFMIRMMAFTTKVWCCSETLERPAQCPKLHVGRTH